MHIGNEANVRAILRHRVHTAGSDGILHGAATHPRAWATFPRFLAHYARDLALVGLPEMVAHMTGRPARRLGIWPARGRVVEGARADLVLFDPGKIRDAATFEEPKRRSEGIRFVLVNGIVALDEGRVTGERAGTILRRGADGTVA